MINSWGIALGALVQTIDYQELVEIILNAKIGKGNYKIEWLSDDEFALTVRKPVYEKISETEYREYGNFYIDAARCSLRFSAEKDKIIQIYPVTEDGTD